MIISVWENEPKLKETTENNLNFKGDIELLLAPLKRLESFKLMVVSHVGKNMNFLEGGVLATF